MENKLGSYINNLMTTVVDKEERFFVRKLAFNELTNLKKDITSFIFEYIDEMEDGSWDGKNENKNQTELKFGDKNENK
jgi:hypothetical protein|tara:strand:+ start:482 stop:715 length:234 start_codon:yes stop_codon:yes gene_type:complete